MIDKLFVECSADAWVAGVAPAGPLDARLSRGHIGDSVWGYEPAFVRIACKAVAVGAAVSCCFVCDASSGGRRPRIPSSPWLALVVCCCGIGVVQLLVLRAFFHFRFALLGRAGDRLVLPVTTVGALIVCCGTIPFEQIVPGAAGGCFDTTALWTALLAPVVGVCLVPPMRARYADIVYRGPVM